MENHFIEANCRGAETLRYSRSADTRVTLDGEYFIPKNVTLKIYWEGLVHQCMEAKEHNWRFVFDKDHWDFYISNRMNSSGVTYCLACGIKLESLEIEDTDGE